MAAPRAALAWGSRLATAGFALLLVSLTACISLDPSESTESAERPNVVVVVTDDQRAYGTLDVMPATRRLFLDGGTHFPNAFATTPYCCPSRATIFTGRYTHNHGVLVNVEENPVLDQRTTVQWRLKRTGYRTAMFGKYLNGWDLGDDPPAFDTWAIFGKTNEAGYYGGEWNIDGTRMRVEDYSTSYIAERAVDFIHDGASAEQPWLMFLSTAAPHPPFTPEPRFEGAPLPPRDWGSLKADAATKPDFVRDRRSSLREARRERRGQLETLMSVDELVADVARALANTGQEQDTLFVFLSDNGYMWGEHGLIRKMLPYDPSVRVPLMLRLPERDTEGREDTRLAATIDVAPTIYDATGVSPPEEVELDGRSLLRPWARDRLLIEFWRAHGRPTWASLRTPEMMYVEYYTRDDRLKARELYDLKVDPGEEINLLADEATRGRVPLNRLARQLARDRVCAGRACP